MFINIHLFSVVQLFSLLASKHINSEIYSSITQLLIPTHAHFHWLKFIKNI